MTVRVNGVGELVGVDIRAGGFDGSDPDDLSDLGDMVVAAYRDAKAQADSLAAEALGPLARRRRRRWAPRPGVLGQAADVRRHRPGPHRRARSAARRRSQERAADRVPPAAGRPRRRTPARRRAGRGQGEGEVLHHLLQRRRGRAVPDLPRPAARPGGAVRGRGVQGRRRDRAHPRVPRSLPRARRRDLAASTASAPTSSGSRSCCSGWPTAPSPRSSSPPTPTSRARPLRPTSRGCSRTSGCA